MKLQRLCFVAALAATISMTFAACNGGDSGIPMTPGMPQSDSGPEMPDPTDSMGPETGGSAEPAPSDTPTVMAPNAPAMPETATSPETSATPEASTTARPSAAPAVSPSPIAPSVKTRAASKSEAPTVSVTLHLNRKEIPPRSYLWFDSTFALRGRDSATFQMQRSQIKLAGHTYSGPTGVVNVTPKTKTAVVTPHNDSIASTFPATTSSKMFMDGLIVYLPGGLPARQTVTWTARFQGTKPSKKDLIIQWQPSVSAYSRFSSSYESLHIKPLTGTPQNFAKNLIPGTATAPSSRNVTICCP